MTPSTLRAVTLKTVANYAHAAERAVVAYRVGGHRLIAALQRGVDLAAQNGPERLALALRRAGGNVGGIATKGLEVVSSRTERAIEIGSNGVTAQLARVADLADGVDNDMMATGLQTAARISLPGAQVALALSERLVAGADKLPGAPVAKAGAAHPRRSTQPQAAVKAVVKAVGTRASKAKKAAAPVVAEIKAAVKPKAARKPAAKPAAKPVVRAVKAAAPAAPARARRAAKAKPVAAAAVQDAATGA